MIEVKNLVKDYGKHHAVKDISFSVPDGQIVGLLGPNGAGKSTTMNIMTGYISATSGEVKIGGYDILEQPLQAKKLIGYLPEIPPLALILVGTLAQHLILPRLFALQVFSIARCEYVCG